MKGRSGSSWIRVQLPRPYRLTPTTRALLSSSENGRYFLRGGTPLPPPFLLNDPGAAVTTAFGRAGARLFPAFLVALAVLEILVAALGGIAQTLPAFSMIYASLVPGTACPPLHSWLTHSLFPTRLTRPTSRPPPARRSPRPSNPTGALQPDGWLG